MRVYVESNFVLELAFQQEQFDSCVLILEAAQRNIIELTIPAYSLVEPNEKVGRQREKRQELQQQLDKELRQLRRTQRYSERLKSIQDLNSLIVQSNEEELKTLSSFREQILALASVIPLTSELLVRASVHETRYDLSPQDAVVYESVISHLVMSEPVESCFLNRNSRDFDNPDIVEALKQRNCKMILRFDDGLAFINSRLERK